MEVVKKDISFLFCRRGAPCLKKQLVLHGFIEGSFRVRDDENGGVFLSLAYVFGCPPPQEV